MSGAVASFLSSLNTHSLVSPPNLNEINVLSFRWNGGLISYVTKCVPDDFPKLSVSPSLLFGLSKVIIDIYFWNAVNHVTRAEI